MDVAALERQIEQKFAPGALLAVQGLANTYDPGGEEELLADPRASRAWLLRSGLATEAIALGDAEHRRLRRFRRLLRSMIEANHRPDLVIDADALAAFTAERGVPLRAGRGAAIELDLAPVAEVDELIAQLLGAIHAAQLTGDWERLKICAADDCRWAFFDSSKNRGGQWCRMELCGNREKNRRYRAARSASTNVQSG